MMEGIGREAAILQADRDGETTNVSPQGPGDRPSDQTDRKTADCQKGSGLTSPLSVNNDIRDQETESPLGLKSSVNVCYYRELSRAGAHSPLAPDQECYLDEDSVTPIASEDCTPVIDQSRFLIDSPTTGVVTLNSPSVGLVTLDLDSCDEDEDSSKLETCCDEYDDLYSLDKYYTPDPSSTDLSVSSASAESLGLDEAASKESGGQHLDSQSEGKQSTDESFCDCVSTLRRDNSSQGSSLTTSLESEDNIYMEPPQHPLEPASTDRKDRNRVYLFSEGLKGFTESLSECPMFCVPIVTGKYKSFSTSAIHTSSNEIGASEIKFSDRGIDTLDLKSTACEMSTSKLKSLDRGRCKSCDVLRAQASDKCNNTRIRPPSLNLDGVPHAVPPGSGHQGSGVNDGLTSPRSPGFCHHRTLDVPQTILDVHYDLLKSGIAILPGCRDIEGCAIVFIFTRSSLWQLQKVSSVELARTLLYYRSVPRDNVQKKGLKLVADIRGASSSTVNTLLETMYLLQGNCPGALSTVYMLANETSEPLVMKSPVYDPLATFRLEVLVSMETLHKYLPPDSIPVALDGHFAYSHEDWIRFQMKLDPFVSKLQAAAKYLVCIMQDLSDAAGVPRTTKEANQLIEHHEQLIKSVFEDQRLMSVQTDGEGVINCLQREVVHLSHSQDYRDSMMSMNELYDNLQTTIVKLVRLSDSRLCKLEQCLQLREFEEECTKVLSWVSGCGEDFFQRYVHLADNLKAIRAQQKEFEKFYYSAMTHIEKGNDLLEEASMLAQSGNFDEVTGYKELARTLKKHLQLFTGRLEEIRERIESTASCYHLLDKTYEWALDAMKYVASMKMEHCSTIEGLDKLLRSLQVYLRDHPMMKEETFISMMDLAKKLRNEKLMEQCRVARARCEETHSLLTARQSTLREAKDRMVLETKTSPSKTDQRRSGQFSVISSPELRHPSVNNDNAVWQPCSASTPSSGSERTPSFCGSGTSPILPPTNLTPQDMVFLGESDSSFITEDMSDRVVTSIPKILNNSTMRSSREDLTSPSDTSSQRSIRSAPTPQDSRGGEEGPGSALTSHNRPLKKVLRRTSTAPPFTGGAIIEEEDPKPRRTDRQPGRQDDSRTVSMITSSTDSLSSMPEEEPENGEVLVPSSKSFTPVPVNTHLNSQNGSIPTGSLADLKLSGTEKIKRTLAHVMREMVQTERDYVCSLQFIIEQYVPELERDDVPQALRGKRNVIFGNLEKIYHFHHQMFLREVELCANNPFQIAQYFIMHASQFYLYAIYNKNKPKSDSLMAEYGKYFFREKQLQLGDKMDLSSYLLKPVQRMGKYALLIKQIMKACPNTEQEYQDLKAAEEMVKFQLRHGNDLLAMDSLRDCDVNFQEQGRLLRQEEFLVWQGRRKSMRHVFLFEDLILFSKTQRGRNGSPDTYNYKFSFKMADVGLTEAYEGSGYKFEIWFRRRSLGDNYILQAPSSDVRHQWTKEISHVLWNQALKNREHHMTEMLSMGVGNKPCLDIKPSANNIQDRLLNYAVGNRGARTRNSVAVTSFEHLRQGNKRPHSIISVSSTSSSSSSHSGMLSILGPNYDMADSPRSRQSIACMSNESGIGTDLSGSENDRQGSLEISRRGPNSRHYINHPQAKLILSNTSSNEPVSTDV
ncbi:puratrophin-1-like isoform X1 [Mizuhopecten yessoensis]|uniref:puratrophin-1-like isoform X1 n=1 Tax=Mizuhopecten yessoensis TaxID=6573 RepID=UPI000B45DEFB|nr:puratrophin-1-like isoform X1 [Mizuhopecten yessoensis]